MGCIPPLRTVSTLQFHKLRSLGQSLVRVLDSALTGSQKSSPRFHSSSERSTYQDLELGESRKQPRKESEPLYESKSLSVTGRYPRGGDNSSSTRE